jgi:hypothetical protein
MDLQAAQTWFRALEPPMKVVVLLEIIFQSTLTMRGLSTYYPGDCETRWRLALHLSEMNHRFAAAASATMRNEETYPDDVLIEMLHDQAGYPELQQSCRETLDGVMRRHSKSAGR